ncbi:UNVERIFIED_CONTAM: hypothetical protein FKN15_037303 [Acipenser sinensis]
MLGPERVNACLGIYNSILVAYQAHLLGSIAETHKPLSQQLDELRLVSRNLLRLSKLNGQAIGSTGGCSQATFGSPKHACLTETKQHCWALRSPQVTFGPVMDEMMQWSHCARESTKELVLLLPKRLPPPCKPATQWHPKPQFHQKPAQQVDPPFCGSRRAFKRTVPQQQARAAPQVILLPKVQVSFSRSHLDY